MLRALAIAGLVTGPLAVDARASDLPSSELAGMGGASVAAPADNTSIPISPANIALQSRYDVQASFVGGPDGDLRWAASIVDGRTSKILSFGLMYDGGLLQRALLVGELPGWAPADEQLVSDRQIHDITFALAAPFLDRKLAVGVNGTLSISQGTYVRQGVTGNIDLSFAARPIEEFTVALTGSDLLPIADQPGTPARVALGLRGGKERMAVGAVDVGYKAEDVATSPWWVRAGFEGTIKFFQIRAGWDWDGERDTHRIGWGLGLRAPMGSLHYAMQVPVITNGFTFASVTHTVSITLNTNIGDRDAETAPLRFDSRSR